MTAKQKWLAERLLMPAGILPPAIKHRDLAINEVSRKKIGNIGFEYFLLMDQNANQVAASVIGKKIFAVHVPFPFFGHSSFGDNRKLIDLITLLVYGKNRIPNKFSISVPKTFAFAAALKAKVVVIHTYHLDHENIPGNLAELAGLEEKYNIKPVLEHEGSYVDTWYTEKRLPWVTKPDAMIKALDKFYPRKKFDICLDTSSLYGYSLPILETAKKVASRTAHLHLAGSLPGVDLATEINQPEIAEMVRYFYDHHLKGFITAEVNGSIGSSESLVAQIYGASSILHFPLLKKVASANAQRHIENSCRFLLDNI